MNDGTALSHTSGYTKLHRASIWERTARSSEPIALKRDGAGTCSVPLLMFQLPHQFPRVDQIASGPPESGPDLPVLLYDIQAMQVYVCDDHPL